MKSRQLQFTLREMRSTFTNPRTWVILLGITMFLGLAGPFGTFAAFGLPARTFYWTFVVLTTFTSGLSIFIWVNYLGSTRTPELWKNALLGGASNGIVVTLIILMLNWATLGIWPFDTDQILLMAGYGISVSTIIFGVMAFFIDGGKKLQRQSENKQPLLLKRLEMEKRGSLISLTVQDHYVEVTTSKGASFILMRMKDAIGETEPTVGHQIHRSHWVATKYIADTHRQGDKAFVTLIDGRELPVSRTYLKPLRAAGVLQF